jgi:hypothetical protein
VGVTDSTGTVELEERVSTDRRTLGRGIVPLAERVVASRRELSTPDIESDVHRVTVAIAYIS